MPSFVTDMGAVGNVGSGSGSRTQICGESRWNAELHFAVRPLTVCRLVRSTLPLSRVEETFPVMFRNRRFPQLPKGVGRQCRYTCRKKGGRKRGPPSKHAIPTPCWMSVRSRPTSLSPSLQTDIRGNVSVACFYVSQFDPNFCNESLIEHVRRPISCRSRNAEGLRRIGQVL
jgi:hypothetical protein